MDNLDVLVECHLSWQFGHNIHRIYWLYSYTIGGNTKSSKLNKRKYIFVDIKCHIKLLNGSQQFQQEYLSRPFANLICHTWQPENILFDKELSFCFDLSHKWYYLDNYCGFHSSFTAAYRSDSCSRACYTVYRLIVVLLYSLKTFCLGTQTITYWFHWSVIK